MGKNMKKRKDEIFIIQKPTIQLQKHSCTRLQLTAANIFEDSYQVQSKFSHNEAVCDLVFNTRNGSSKQQNSTLDREKRCCRLRGTPDNQQTISQIKLMTSISFTKRKSWSMQDCHPTSHKKLPSLLFMANAMVQKYHEGIR